MEKSTIKFGHILIIGILMIMHTKIIQSLYTRFFAYGDIDGDNIISCNDVNHRANEAWTKEWYILLNRMSEEIQSGFREGSTGVSWKQFRDMSMPGGMYINLKYGHDHKKYFFHLILRCTYFSNCNVV